MRVIQSVFLALVYFGLTACGETDTNEKQSVVLKASGLSKQVNLTETVHGTTHTITQNGNHQFNIDKGIYHFEIVDTDGQSCELTPQLDLACNQGICTTDYTPVCGKKPFVNVCITAPCTTDVYQTFSNSCSANAQNAWTAMDGECQDLEGVVALHTKPARLVPLAVFDYYTDQFELISSEINQDTLTLVTRVGGGCGTHEVTLFVNNAVSSSSGQLMEFSTGISHLDYDNCEALTQVTNEFDLLTVKENYRRLFPEASGVIQVKLNELGIYQFEL